ncbi:hypothetical protein B4N89_43535 [Embleya scabrispora]|uniref:Uncharacterized protein n=1 Tax=Embleya scabrispora TaxID=159449 RepID=A0A1T3NKZ2_9ACTN|nr:hypothetical protein B4N89_43535 [Embleya scabrispora]
MDRRIRQVSIAARSAALRSTQNSLPSGSARITQPDPSGFRWSAKSVAPRPSSRSTSSSRDVSGRRHRWTRFLTVLASDTWLKNNTGPSASCTSVSRAPGLSSGCSGRPVTPLQNRANS